MKGTENLIWNRLVYGASYSLRTAAAETAIVDDEKRAMQEKYALEEIPVKPAKKHPHPLFNPKILSLFYLLDFAGLIALYFFITYEPSACLPSVRTTQGGLLDTGFGLQHVQKSNESHEIISLAYPFIPKASYGEPVHSALLIDHKFKTWGQPSIASFKPPKNTDYNKVVLTLNVSVDGVQYDRLGHLYVGGSEIWRTSTIEPGSKKVHSSFKKDVTEYVSLFHDKTDVVFQLDNNVNEHLTGVFHVQLSADFYLSEYFHSAEVEELGSADLDIQKKEIYKYFDVRGAASKVFSLKKNETSPLKHLPSQVLEVKLPKVSQNTTRLKLNIFASGNAGEEDWYSNVLDKFVDRFGKDGVYFEGHGPLRYVTVWLDGKKLAVQTLQPFIFTGGFSPALWRSVVPTNAFDLPSIDLDISPILPYLWDKEEHVLKIEVDNGLDEIQSETSGIGNDWLVSANLLTYEKPNVKLVSGQVLELSDTKRGLSFGISLPSTSSIIQNAKGLFETSVKSQFIVELESGEVLNATMASSFSGKVVNIQNRRLAGHISDVVHTGTSLKSFALTVDEEEIRLSDIKLVYFLTFKESLTPVEGGTDLDVSLVNVKVLDLDVDKKPAMKETEKQEGQSEFHIRETGNYGNGSLLTKFKSKVHGPNYGFVYKRRVKVEGDEITEDKDSFKHHEDKEEW